MEEQDQAADHEIQVVCVGDSLGWTLPMQIKREPKEMAWEVQEKEVFLKVTESLHSEQENLTLTKSTPWDDTKVFPSCFEGVASACKWLTEEWGIRPRPILKGEGQPATGGVNSSRVRTDSRHGKDGVLLSGMEGAEAQRQQFRQFSCPEVGGLREVYHELRDLCQRWLKPEKHSKEQILELVVLEQFLTLLPQELQSWVRDQDLETCAHVIPLAEDFLRRQQEVKRLEQEDAEPFVEVMVDSPEGEDIPLDLWQRPHPDEIHQEWGRKAGMLGDVLFFHEEEYQSRSRFPTHNQGKRPLVASGEARSRLASAVRRPAWPIRRPAMSESRSCSHQGKLPLVVSGEAIETPMRQAFLWATPAALQPGGGCMTLEKEEGNRQRGRSGPAELHRIFPGESRRCLVQYENVEDDSGPKKEVELPTMTIWAGPTICMEADGSTPKGTLAGKTVKHLCPECGRNFQHKSTLIRHQKIHTGEKPHICLECGKAFRRRDKLIRHQQIHTGQKPHACLECGKSFRERGKLVNHQRIHTGEKPYTCPVCQKPYRWKEEFVKHLRIHTGERPYACLQCGKAFISKAHLVSHQRIHTGEKPYECPECRRRFCSKQSLTKHGHIHAGETSYECQDCGRVFHYISNFTKHQRIHACDGIV